MSVERIQDIDISKKVTGEGGWVMVRMN